MGCTALGWLCGVFYPISPPVYALGFAHLAGGIVAAGAVNDLPRVKSAPALAAFLAGAFIYSVLLLAIEAFSLQAYPG